MLSSEHACFLTQPLKNISGRRHAVAAVAALSLLLSGTGRANANTAHHSQHGPILGTLVLQGTMSSTATMSMTGAFSIGHAANFQWDLPLPSAQHMSGYSETIQPTYTFDVAPNSFQDTAVDGLPVRRFSWTAPPDNTVIHVTETLHAGVTTKLDRFVSTARYPMAAVPAEVQPFLAPGADTTLPASATGLLSRLVVDKTTQRGVVEAVVNWVASHTHYSVDRTNGPFDAASVLLSHQAACRGYTDLALAMLRRLGIPARAEFGMVLGGPVNLPGPSHGKSSVQWTATSHADLHTWMDVWFPDVGWVPMDPQAEKFFVDPRHIALFTQPDAGSSLGIGSWDADANDDNSSSTGKGLPDASGATQIVPGMSAGTRVTAHVQDDFRVKFSRLQHDVSGLMFSR